MRYVFRCIKTRQSERVNSIHVWIKCRAKKSFSPFVLMFFVFFVWSMNVSQQQISDLTSYFPKQPMNTTFPVPYSKQPWTFVELRNSKKQRYTTKKLLHYLIAKVTLPRKIMSKFFKFDQFFDSTSCLCRVLFPFQTVLANQGCSSCCDPDVCCSMYLGCIFTNCCWVQKRHCGLGAVGSPVAGGNYGSA